MPKTLAVLQTIGRFIVADSQGRHPAPPLPPPPPAPSPPPLPPPSPPAPGHHPVPPLPPPLSPPLKPLLRIEWQLLPWLPMGVEDNDGGWIDADTLVTAFGLSQRGPCVSTAYAINVSEPAPQWRELPSCPGAPRQEEAGSIVNGKLWYGGGFQAGGHCGPKKSTTLDDMWTLSHTRDDWVWEPQPGARLPFPICCFALATIGDKLYLFGGSFDEGQDKPPNVHAMLHVLDTNNIIAGWKRLPDCPGTGGGGILAPAGGKLHVMGAIDSWRYDPTATTWSRLADNPLPNLAKTNGNTVFMDRYIVLVGGAANFNVTSVDGKQHPYPARPMRIEDGTCNITACSDPSKEGINYWYGINAAIHSWLNPFVKLKSVIVNRGYDNAVLVFDVKLNHWGTIEAVSEDPELLGPHGECGPFPSNVALPQVSVRGDRIAVVGGEADERVIHGHKYSHDSDMAVVGTMTALQ